MVESADKKPSFKESVRTLLRNPDLDRKLVPQALLEEYDKYHPINKRVALGPGTIGTAHTGEGNQFDLGPTLGSGNVWGGGDRYGEVIIRGKGALDLPIYARITNEGTITFVTSDGGIMMQDEIYDEDLEDLSIVVGQDFNLGRIRVHDVNKIVAVQAKGGYSEGLPFEPMMQDYERAIGRVDPKTSLMP